MKSKSHQDANTHKLTSSPGPFNIRAEEEVLKTMLHEDGAGAREAARKIVTDEDFYHTYNGRFFLAILERHDAKVPIDDLNASCYKAIEKDYPKIGTMGALEYIEELRISAETGLPDKAIYWAEQMKDPARRRGYRSDMAILLQDIDSDTQLEAQDVRDRLLSMVTVHGPSIKTEPDREAARVLDIDFSLDTYLPPEGLLRDYLMYMLPMTEAPPQYHVFAGLMMLATVIEQKAYFVIADERKYLNLWAVLVGPSGCKKSTSINKARQILANTGFKNSLFPTQVTSEALIPMLEYKSVGTFFWSEWGATMDQWGKTYAQDMMSLVTDLFDGGYFSRSLKGVKYDIESSSINLFCGCTYDWLRKTMKGIDIGMGFWPRFMFVPAMRREKYFANPEKGNIVLRDRIDAEIKAIKDHFTSEYPEEVSFDDVDDMYTDWYERTNRAADEDVENQYMASFIVRLSDYAKKLAALVQISSDHSVEVKSESMEYALKLVDWVKDAVLFVVSQATKGDASQIEDRVFEAIAQSGDGGILHSRLRQKLNRFSRTEIEMAISSLEDAGRIRVSETGKTGRGRPGKRYFAAQVTFPLA